MWINLLYADLDTESYGLPPDEEGTLLDFARMGIADEALAPKPASAPWRGTFARPLRAAD